MAEKLDFNVYLTEEALAYATVAGSNAGWRLLPLKWAVSADNYKINSQTDEPVISDLTLEQVQSAFIAESPFSGISKAAANKLNHSVVIPPNLLNQDTYLTKIYFIYKDFYDNEFLFGVAQSVSDWSFIRGVSQNYVFVFGINGLPESESIFEITYTYPQDIEDHNIKEDAHDYLLARDGSRTATGILQYDEHNNFENGKDIVDKYYVDKEVAMNSFSSISSTANSLHYCEKQSGFVNSAEGHYRLAEELNSAGNFPASMYEYEQIVNLDKYRR